MNNHSFDGKVIAPCGMNCGICRVYLRPDNPCPGCNNIGEDQPKTRVNCQLRLCTRREGMFCYLCTEFPCNLLKRLDTRYRARYGMSEIGNLEYIRDNGMETFIEKESGRWISNNGILCIHDKNHYKIREKGRDQGKKI